MKLLVQRMLYAGDLQFPNEYLVKGIVSNMQGPDSRVDFFKIHVYTMLYVFVQVQLTMS